VAESDPSLRGSQAGSVPIPDPTAQTSAALSAAKEEMGRELQHVQAVLMAHMGTIEAKIGMIEAQLQDYPRLIDHALREGKDLLQERLRTHDERFHGIQVQFQERDKRADEASRATQTAIDAALVAQRESAAAQMQAQKEAAAVQHTHSEQAQARIEVTTQHQIEQLMTLLHATTGAITGKVDDLKELLTLIEGRTVGMTAATGRQDVIRTSGRQRSSQQIAIIAVIVSAISLIAMVLLRR
jgi:vacuolar-type H+-ATPase subunit I/STV1